VAVGPGAVAGRTLRRRQGRAARGEPGGERLGVDQAVAGARRGQHAARVLDLAGLLGLPVAGLRQRYRVVLAEQLVGLVEDRHVGLRPRCGGLAEQQAPLACGQLRRGLGQPVRLGVQVPDQLLGRDRQPRDVERHADGAVRAQVLEHRRAVLARQRRAREVAVLVGEAVEHFAHERTARQVVRLVRAAGARDRVADVLGADHEVVPLDPHRRLLLRHTFPGAHGPADDLAPQQQPLEPGHLPLVDRGRPDAGDEVAHRRGHHAGLAQRRQHLVDVAQERAGRPHHEHARAFQQAPVGVQEVGRAVQRHRRLAGTRAALHHQRAGQVGADDAVLLGLDGRDDVGHPAGAALGHRREQRALAGERVGVDLGVEVEDLVLQAGHRAALGHQVAPPPDVAGVQRRGAVERLGRRGAPVGQDRAVLGVRQADAPDVPCAAVGQVEAAEDQPVLDGVELRRAVLVERGERVALAAVLVRALGPRQADVAQAVRRRAAEGVQADVHRVDDCLLVGELARDSRHALPPWFTSEKTLAANQPADHYRARVGLSADTASSRWIGSPPWHWAGQELRGPEEGPVPKRARPGSTARSRCSWSRTTTPTPFW
jgi:hypothetical protein